MVSAVLLAILSAGLQLGSSGVLFASQVHKRNVALSAAEAGVYQAIARIQKDRGANGTFTETLAESGATVRYTLTNNLASSTEAIVISTGEYGGSTRTLRAELEPDSAGFPGLAVQGKVYIFDQAYFNAIASADNPVARPGNAHSSYTAGGQSFVGRDYDGDGRSRVHVTGTLSAEANIDTNLQRTAREVLPNTSRPTYKLDESQMLSQGSFTSRTESELAAGGTLTANAVVNGPLKLHGKLHLPKGVTLHVRGGNAEFLGGVSGDGQIVVDGEVLIRADSLFDPSVKEGVKIRSRGSAYLVHPSVSGGDADLEVPPPNVVGDYFAQMPMNAAFDLSTNLPTNAPKGGSFFTWFDDNVGQGDANFHLWYNGDGTDIYPGLSEETKTWLNHSRPIHQQIRSWADAP